MMRCSATSRNANGDNCSSTGRIGLRDKGIGPEDVAELVEEYRAEVGSAYA